MDLALGSASALSKASLSNYFWWTLRDPSGTQISYSLNRLHKSLLLESQLHWELCSKLQFSVLSKLRQPAHNVLQVQARKISCSQLGSADSGWESQELVIFSSLLSLWFQTSVSSAKSQLVNTLCSKSKQLLEQIKQKSISKTYEFWCSLFAMLLTLVSVLARNWLKPGDASIFGCSRTLRGPQILSKICLALFCVRTP